MLSSYEQCRWYLTQPIGLLNNVSGCFLVKLSHSTKILWLIAKCVQFANDSPADILTLSFAAAYDSSVGISNYPCKSLASGGVSEVAKLHSKRGCKRSQSTAPFSSNLFRSSMYLILPSLGCLVFSLGFWTYIDITTFVLLLHNCFVGIPASLVCPE